MQGSFNVWTEHKREKIKDIRLRPMHRHLFLYEKAVLLCKRKEDTQNGDRDVFSFKNMLRVSKNCLMQTVYHHLYQLKILLRFIIDLPVS